MKTRPLKYTRTGMSKTPFYRVWLNMRARCNNENHTLYKYYGGRGISVCETWASFENFYADMFDGYAQGLQLDRIDNDKGYSKNNCRWVSAKTNNRNRRSNRRVITPIGEMTLIEASEKYGVDHSLISYRIRRGYSISDVFSSVDMRSRA